MKNIIYAIGLILAISLFISCKDVPVTATPTATSVNIEGEVFNIVKISGTGVPDIWVLKSAEGVSTTTQRYNNSTETTETIYSILKAESNFEELQLDRLESLADVINSKTTQITKLLKLLEENKNLTSLEKYKISKQFDDNLYAVYRASNQLNDKFKLGALEEIEK